MDNVKVVCRPGEEPTQFDFEVEVGVPPVVCHCDQSSCPVCREKPRESILDLLNQHDFNPGSGVAIDSDVCPYCGGSERDRLHGNHSQYCRGGPHD
jgi:hypothetical protein